MRRFVPAVCLLVGFALGVALTSHVWVVQSRVLDESVLAEYIVEQEFLAARAARAGQTFREGVHWMNAADAEAELGFRWLERSRHASYVERAASPWLTCAMLWSVDLPDRAKRARGRAILEAQTRAKAAVALERVPLLGVAELEWARVRELPLAWSIEQHREFAAEQSSLPFLVGLADAYLDSTTRAELGSALAELRKRMPESP